MKFNNKQINIDRLFKIIDIRPKNKSIYIQALTHSTFANENKNYKSYEILEFVGDSILQMFSSLYIYERFKDEEEGNMSIIRSKFVSSSALAKVIKELQINELLICSNNRNELINNEKICSDIFESLTAAIYLDLGVKETKRFLDDFLFRTINIKKSNLKDAKTQLQELLQPIFKKPIQYICEVKDGVWKCKAQCIDIIYGSGTGKTKKDAEIKAAESALKKLKVN